jgi:hypothetical protein
MNTPAPASPARDYVRADYIAAAIGLSLLALENHFRPEAWASPRDFRFPRRASCVEYAVESLPQLVVALEVAGERAAAEKLRAYIAALAKAAPDYFRPEECRPLAVAKADGPPPPVLARGHASDREQVPHSWAADWEAARE